jgi:tetratricopeptide (TPR) repeat protein
MRQALFILFLLGSYRAFPAESGILEKAVKEGMRLIADGKIAESMNEIRAGFNSQQIDNKAVSVECLNTLDDTLADEKDARKKAALLVYRAVLFLVSRQANSPETAIELLNSAERADNKLPEIFNTRGICHLMLRDAAKAQDDFNKAIALNADYWDALDNRGYLQRMLNEKPDVRQDINYYERYDKRVNAKIAECSEAIRLAPNAFMLRVMRARSHHERGLIDEALADLDAAEKLSPGNYDVVFQRALLFWQAGRVDDVLLAGMAALKIRPGDAAASVICGLALCENGEYAQATARYDAAIETGKHADYALFDRGVVHFYKGEIDASIADCSAALDANSAFLPARCFRGRMYQIAGDEQKAKADFQTTANAHAPTPYDLAMRADAHAALGDFETALSEFNALKIAAPFDRWLDFSAACVYCLRAKNAGSKTRDADITEAIRLLSEAAKKGMKNWAQIRAFPEIKVLFGDPRFEALTVKKP